MQPDKELIPAGILRQVNKAGIAVFKDIIDQFLYHAEDDQLVLRLKPLPVVMKPGAGVHASRAADLLEKIIDSRLKAKVLERRRHQAMGYITYQLDRIINNGLGIVDALQLGWSYRD